MVSFPPCKINLGLSILRKRDDGYHDIETCFYPVPYCDIVEVIPADTTSFSSSGNEIPGKAEDNLCLLAVKLLEKDLNLGPAKIHLHKLIPMGAGLGGGSSDAAHVLRLLDKVFQLRLSKDELRVYASKLGSDCSFFIEDIPMMGRGRGEILSPVKVSLEGRFLILVTPPIHITTSEAYRAVTPREPDIRIQTIVEAKPLHQWKELLVNDFEYAVFQQYPIVQSIKEILYGSGAVYASMSGSGSSVFGIFEKEQSIPEEFSRYNVWSGMLR